MITETTIDKIKDDLMNNYVENEQRKDSSILYISSFMAVLINCFVDHSNIIYYKLTHLSCIFLYICILCVSIIYFFNSKLLMFNAQKDKKELIIGFVLKIFDIINLSSFSLGILTIIAANIALLVG